LAIEEDFTQRRKERKVIVRKSPIITMTTGRGSGFAGLPWARAKR